MGVVSGWRENLQRGGEKNRQTQGSGSTGLLNSVTPAVYRRRRRTKPKAAKAMRPVLLGSGTLLIMTFWI